MIAVDYFACTSWGLFPSRERDLVEELLELPASSSWEKKSAGARFDEAYSLSPAIQQRISHRGYNCWTFTGEACAALGDRLEDWARFMARCANRWHATRVDVAVESVLGPADFERALVDESLAVAGVEPDRDSEGRPVPHIERSVTGATVYSVQVKRRYSVERFARCYRRTGEADRLELELHGHEAAACGARLAGSTVAAVAQEAFQRGWVAQTPEKLPEAFLGVLARSGEPVAWPGRPLPEVASAWQQAHRFAARNRRWLRAICDAYGPSWFDEATRYSPSESELVERLKRSRPDDCPI